MEDEAKEERGPERASASRTSVDALEELAATLEPERRRELGLRWRDGRRGGTR